MPSGTPPAQIWPTPLPPCHNPKFAQHSPQHRQHRGRSMDFRNVDKLNRRDMIRGAAMLGAGATLIAPVPPWAQSGTMADIRQAAEAGKAASVKRLRD